MSDIETPPNTRLILVSENLLESFGTRTEDGRMLTAEWGEQKPEGWYEPVFTASGEPRILDLKRELAAAREDADRLAEALRDEMNSYHPAQGVPRKAADALAAHKVTA